MAFDITGQRVITNSLTAAVHEARSSICASQTEVVNLPILPNDRVNRCRICEGISDHLPTIVDVLPEAQAPAECPEIVHHTISPKEGVGFCLSRRRIHDGGFRPTCDLPPIANGESTTGISTQRAQVFDFAVLPENRINCWQS